MKHAVLSLFLAPALLAGPGSQKDLVRAEASVDAMGTAFSIAAYGEDRQKLQSPLAQALEEARRLDQMLSNYKPESEWSQVNRFAAERPVSVSPELFDLLAACVEI